MTERPLRTAGASGLALVNGSVEGACWLIMLPSVAREFHASKPEIAWVVIAFALGLAGAGLAAGRLCDLIGAKRVGVVTFAVEVALLVGIVLAPALWMLYPLRFLQGVMRAGSVNASAALLIGSFSPKSRGQVLGGRYALVYGGQLLGAVYAGFVTDAWGWRAAIAGVTVAMSVCMLLLVAFARRDPEQHESLPSILRRFDWPGAIAFLLAISVLIFSTQMFRGHTSQWGVVALVIAAGILYLAIRTERQASTPALDLKLFRSVPFSAATASLMIMALCLGTANFLFPFYMQEGLGWSTSVSATAFVAMNFVQMIASPVMGGIADRLGARRLVVSGASMVVAGLVVASLLGGGVHPWQVASVMLLLGLGMSVFETPNNSVIFHHAGAALGAASAITGVYRFVGLSLGGAFGASLLTVLGDGDIVSAFGTGMLILASIAFLGLLSMQLVQVYAGRKGPTPVEVPAKA